LALASELGIVDVSLRVLNHRATIAIDRCWLAFLVICFSGCQRSPEPMFRLNAVELLKQERNNLQEGEHYSDSYKSEIANLLTATFGTPNEPRFPQLFGDDPDGAIVSIDKLKMAAGPVKSGRRGEPAGLYREHCVHCHGISGDGAGPTAGFLNPYPRDFRLGKFKFKSTPLRRPPTDDDIVRTIRNGIAGTAMPSFRALSEEEVSALVDYTKYLAIRGMYERRLMAEIDSLDGDPILNLDLIREQPTPVADPSNGSSSDPGPMEDAEVRREEFEQQLETVVGEYLKEEIISRWIKPERLITKVPAPQPSFDFQHPARPQLVRIGSELFRGKANCTQCHGDTGIGDGQTENYDDWTNDWLKTVGVDPFFPETFQPFIDAGAFRPRHVRPRNLRMPVFRGGNRPEDIYRRIADGIEGTPMPSAPTLSPQEIWALVAYVQSLPYEHENAQSKSIAANRLSPRDQVAD
jgi:mono/diheme cytochrome c family protein